jgi:pimeloyl-ACP methyl ester carboxylesterase/DNA-binding winged helix-turn-helix (wHTH) protein
MSSPPVRFVTAPDGVRLAYAVYGQGPPLVWAAHWLSHLEYAWQSPVWRHIVEFFARHFTVIRYDERGCGLSDWTDKNLGLETWVSDLGIIADTLKLEKFDLLGISQGGPIAIEYAVRHPERVRKLILCGSFSKGAFIPLAQSEALGKLIELGWGQDNPAFRQLFTSLFIPDATEEQRNWFNELQKRSTSPVLAAKLYRAIQTLDVSDRLALVSHPTLVLHSSGDAAIPFSVGRALAAGIPHARLVPLAGDNHLTLETTPGWPVFRREVAAFAEFAEAETDDTEPTDAPAPAETPEAGGKYLFGRCKLDSRSRELWRDGQAVPIEHRAFDMLLYLLEHRDRAISKDELQEAIWPRMILTESALTRCVMKVRRAVGDDPQRQSIIKTIHGHGYRFVAPLGPASAS